MTASSRPLFTRLLLVALAALPLPIGAVARAQQLSAVRVAAGLDAPIYAAAPSGDPRLFIVERGGAIRILADGVLLPGAFLDIADRVDAAGEGGLLGLAFAPDYASSGQFYVYYTAGPRPGSALESRVSRFSALGNPSASIDADEESEEILFSLDQPADTHDGGTIAVRGGYLYLGLGDGGGAGDPLDAAQSDATLLGKFVRFALDACEPGACAPEVWAKGFRNPFRWSFDRDTGDLYVGDVGQGALEEIDVERADAPGGRNYGWDVMEGTGCFDPDPGEPACGAPELALPVHEYPHTRAPCDSVTGGAVYRGAASPALRGRYFFADFCRNQIWSLRWNRDTGLAEDLVEHTGEIETDAGAIGSVVAIAEDAAGELHFVDLLGGEVFRLVPEPASAALGLAACLVLAALARRRGC